MPGTGLQRQSLVVKTVPNKALRVSVIQPYSVHKPKAKFQKSQIALEVFLPNLRIAASLRSSVTAARTSFHTITSQMSIV